MLQLRHWLSSMRARSFSTTSGVKCRFPYEWKDMPQGYGSEEERRARGPFYAILKRIEAQKEFFERAWKIQVRCTALFGPNVEEVFLLMHRDAARSKFQQKCCGMIPGRASRPRIIWRHGIDFARTFGLRMKAVLRGASSRP